MTVKKRQPKKQPKKVQPTLREKLWALETVVLMVRRLRVLLAEHSIVFFAWYYLGIRLALHQEIWAHLIILAKWLLMLCPRDHGKTEVASKIYPLWRICKNRNIRIVMLTKASDLATRNSMLIRGELRENTKLIADFGVFYDHEKSGVWQQSKWQVIRSKTMKDPTFTAIGIDAAGTGNRCDLLIGDDVIDEDSVRNPDVISKIITLIKGTYFPLVAKTGQILFIGTRKNFNDLYGHLMKQPGWRVLIQKGVLRMPAAWHIEHLKEPWIDENGFERFERVVIDGPDRGKVLWPEARPIEWLLEQRMIMGTPIWEREIQNNPVDEETAMFKQAELEQCRDESMSYVAGILPDEVRSRYVVIMHGVDPSLVTEKKHAEKTDSDYMVQIAIGLTREGRRDILAIDRIRGLSPDQVEKRIKEFYVRFNPYRCAIEKNAFGIIHAHNLIEGTDMRIHKHHTGLNKNDPYEGVPHLSALFENVKYRLPYATDYDKEITDAFIAELHAFGSDVHDDQVMAAWITEYVILRYLAWKAGQRKMQERVATVRA
jgi:hypothetical protein